ncbi:MAG: major capsid protein, partial [Christensenellales bacterium]
IFIPATASTEAEFSSLVNIKQVGRIPNAVYFGHNEIANVGTGSQYFEVHGSYFNYSTDFNFPDGTSVFSTRQRNYARDYFTAATISPQQGNASRLVFDVDVDSEDGAFTIGALRAANSLQKFLETNNLSQDYADMMRNRWGTRPKDADFEEPYYLGRVVLPVYQKGIYQNQSTDTPQVGGNPFAAQGALGAKGGSAAFAGQGSICDKYHSTTWSYVMCLFSLVPHAMYGTGINRELTIRKIGDFPAPEMQTVGHEAIYSYELNSGPNTGDKTFGYIPRYSRFKYMDDEVHGELRPGKSLHSFVLQRRLGADDISLTTGFLEIPQDALDDIFAVSTKAMKLSCWYEIFFEFKVSMPLADFCIPTLGELEDTHTIKSPHGGSRL